jgi:hypothetical protein
MTRRIINFLNFLQWMVLICIAPAVAIYLGASTEVAVVLFVIGSLAVKEIFRAMK